MSLLLETYRTQDETRPSVIFASTVKERRLPTEGHLNNHSALLTGDQMLELHGIDTGSILDAAMTLLDR